MKHKKDKKYDKMAEKAHMKMLEKRDACKIKKDTKKEEMKEKE